MSKPFDPARIVSFITALASQQENESFLLLQEDQEQTEYLQGVLNQKDFMLSASKELSFAIRNKNELAIALARIDQFGLLESHYSEPAIDHILMTTAEVIRQHIHPDDILAYFGEGLFSILRPASNAIGTRYIGRRIVEDLAAKQFYLGESDEVVSLSIGISAPHIKPGIRLSELLLLAEGRLKAAMDLGGHRVIDKGNDTLTPVSSPTDSVLPPLPDTEISSSLQSDGIKSSHLSFDGMSRPSELVSARDPEELEEKLEQLQATLDVFRQENRDLQGQVDRLRSQSGESEQLRRRVFELESEQQQMQLKLNEVSAANSSLQKRTEEAEAAHQRLLDDEEEKTLTLKQANQFYEQENLRLEGQLEALSNRAQKAEQAHRRSEQLVISLKDNIKLLRAQMEQIQNHLAEVQHQNIQNAAAPAETAGQDHSGLHSDTDPLLDEDTHIEDRSDSDLVFNPFPSGSAASSSSPQATVTQLFAESQPPERKKVSPANTPTQAKPAESQQPNLSIPVYRAEPREKPPREPRTLSSFAIASMIMLLMVGLGGAYVYNYWTQDSPQAAPQTTEGTTAPSSAAADRGSKDKSPVEALSQAAETSSPAPTQHSEAPRTAPSASIGEEARLQAEMTLRQMAEEEFQQRLQMAGGASGHQDFPPEDGGAGSNAVRSVPQSGQPASETVPIPSSSMPLSEGAVSSPDGVDASYSPTTEAASPQ